MRLSQFDDYLVELHKDTNLLFSSQYEVSMLIPKFLYKIQNSHTGGMNMRAAIFCKHDILSRPLLHNRMVS